MQCEFRLTDGGTVVGTKELDALPKVDDEVTVEGKVYEVDTLPARKPAGNETAVIYVRRPFGF
jgi:hypothetical protein